MRVVIALVVSAVVATACSSDGGPSSGDDESYNCAAEDRDDTFVVGLRKMGTSGKLSFELVEATPAPPARGDNTWVLRLTSQTAAPVTGAAMVVTPFMPDHQHGTPTTVTIEPMTDPGTYRLTPVNMWMPGLWQTTIQVEGQDADKVVFAFCIPS